MPVKKPQSAAASARTLVQISRRLADQVDRLDFAAPITHVYNPLRYARRLHEQYLTRYARARGGVLLVGMNPGPWGMAQTGVPFGEVTAVRDWLGLDATVDRPPHEHAKRPVLGLASTRSEVSGARLWGWARARFGTPDKFFARFFVHNYCPLAFLLDSGANFTPDKLPRAEKDPLFDLCDRALVAVVDALEPRAVIGGGAFATQRAQKVLAERELPIGTLLHPSPASPAANRGWAPQAERQLAQLGALD